MKPRGFTLVELSIVLVIIGLLIGGILVAQSMIGTAKVQAFVRELQQFDIAVTNFQTKYNSIPGDSPAFGCVKVSNVCGNNIIEDSTGNAANYTLNWESETANFWPNLSASGFNVNGENYTATVTGSFKIGGANANVPRMPLGGNTAGVIIYNEPYYTLNNFYVIADWSQVTTQIWSPTPREIIPAVSALAIDVKIDDGKANSGIVMGPDEGSTRTCVGSSDSIYSTQSSAKCVLFYMMQLN